MQYVINQYHRLLLILALSHPIILHKPFASGAANHDFSQKYPPPKKTTTNKTKTTTTTNKTSTQLF